jgi:hypothetical protein
VEKFPEEVTAVDANRVVDGKVVTGRGLATAMELQVLPPLPLRLMRKLATRSEEQVAEAASEAEEGVGDAGEPTEMTGVRVGEKLNSTKRFQD